MSHTLEQYYRLHARFYDATRWSFLFGRSEIIRRAAQFIQPTSILEVGCGTGKNLLALHKTFPQASIEGLDLSPDMLERARKRTASAGDRIRVSQRIYNAESPRSANQSSYDLIFFSYCLSMINPGFADTLQTAAKDLSARGVIAVVDFHDSRFAWFRSWMGLNQVRLNGQLIPELQHHFKPLLCEFESAYLGLWSFFCFLGRKK